MTPAQEERVSRISRNPIPVFEVESSQIAAIGHDPETNTLAVRFNPRAGDVSGPLYHYGNVDAETFRAFQDAKSIGSFFHKVIKPDATTYPYVKIEDGEKAPEERIQSAA